MSKSIQPSDFELQILGVLWNRGEATARQVLEALPDNKPRAYTSVLSVMQVMEKKGFLTHRLEGKANIYRAKVTQSRIMGGVMGRLVDLVFGGRRTAVLQTLLEDKSLSPEELAEMRRVIEEKQKPKR